MDIKSRLIRWIDRNMSNALYRIQNSHRTQRNAIISMVNTKTRIPIDLLDHLKKSSPSYLVR